MTSEQFFELPEPIGNVTYELHFGELIEVIRSNKGQFDLQARSRDVLIKALGLDRWLIEIEIPYGLNTDDDVRAADVGVVSRQDWDQVPGDGYLTGSPYLVVQVKSRSNRDRKMEQDAIDHITHGAVAVWLVKPERREIVVVTASARAVYGSGDRIALPSPLSGNCFS